MINAYARLLTLTFFSVHYEFVRYVGSLSYGCYDSLRSIYLLHTYVMWIFTNRLFCMSVICRWNIDNLDNSGTKKKRKMMHSEEFNVTINNDTKILKPQTFLNGAGKKWIVFSLALPVWIFQMSKNRAPSRKTMIRKRFIIRAILRLRQYN